MLADLESARDDERVFIEAQAQLTAVVVAVLGAVLVFVGPELVEGGPQQGADGEARRVPDILLAALPLLPLMLWAYLLMQGVAASIRTYYIRSLEREVRRRMSVRVGKLDGLHVPVLFELTADEVSLRRGPLIYRATIAVIFAGIVILFGVACASFVSALDGGLLVGAAVFYATCVAVLVVQTARVTVGGRRRFEALLERRLAAPDSTDWHGDGRAPGERSMLGYLLLPRPQDLIKWVFLPVAFFLFYLSGSQDGSSTTLAEAALLWVTLEYLIYSARYQLNDIRGFAEDQAHPDKANRRRLPGPPIVAGRRFLVSGTVALARVIAAVLVGLAVPTLLWPVLILLVVVGASGWLYERLRTRELDSGLDGWHGRCLWLVVGVGYAVRGVAGALLAGERSPWLLAGLALALWCFGIQFVTQTWTLEATSRIRPGTPGPASTVGPTAVDAGPHIALLATWFTDAPSSTRPGMVAPEVPNPQLWRVTGGRARLRAPWAAAYVLAVTLAASVGLSLDTAPDPALMAAAVLITACFGVEAVRVAGWNRVVPVLLGAVVVAAVAGGTPLQRLLAAAPQVVIGLTLTAFGASSWYELKHPFDVQVRAIRTTTALALRTLLGPGSWDLVRPKLAKRFLGP